MHKGLSPADPPVPDTAPVGGTDASAGLPPAVRHLSATAAATLRRWHAPACTVAAALAFPLLEHGAIAADALNERFGEEVESLTGRFAEWHSSGLARLGGETPGTPPMTTLRRLFRQVYLELPGLDLVLLALAYHEAAFQEGQPGWESLAAGTVRVGIPLAEMLGMWDLRCDWLERSTRVLSPGDYGEMERLSSESRKQRAEAYEALVGDLQAKTEKTRLHLEPQLVPRLPAVTLYRAQRGEALQELADRLTVRILCRSEMDCYSALCLVHALGKPVDPRFSQRFDDYIASPQPNGYRALHTAITYKGPNGEILVELRILTRAMQVLNSLGVVAVLYQRPDLEAVPAWWDRSRLERLNSHLHRRYGCDLGIQQFLAQHDLGTRSNPLYVFTPRGEIVLLPEGSTALDFAYHIHTQLGNHAGKIEINGQHELYNYPLRNGDLGQVEYDARRTGPDLSWPGLATTSSVRSKIRAALAKRAGGIHPGRAQLEHVLLKALQYYKEKKHCDLTVTTGRLDAFLLHFAENRGFSDVRPLYAQMAERRLSPNKLVHLLISEELAAGLVDANGRPAPYPRYHVRFCDACRPVPGEALVAFERRVRAGGKVLVVHTADCRVDTRPSGKKIGLRWAERSISDEVFAELQVFAQDRFHVMGDLLDIIYDYPGIYLHRASAQAYGDGQASASLTVRAHSLQQLSELQSRLGHVRNVGQVFCNPLPPAQRLALSIPSRVQRANPYTEHEVYDRWMFVDREAQVMQVLKWLQEPPPTRLVILHGQRRVGKTSLAKHLTYEVLPHYGVVPVFVDLQGLSTFTSQAIAAHLVEHVCQALARPIPAPDPAETPVQWASRVLAEVAAEQHGYRLMLLIDEFHFLLDMRNEGHLEPAVLPNLRSLLNQRRDLNWLLIMDDAHYLDAGQWGDAGPLFQQATTMPLTHLDSDWTEKLVLEPTRRCGLGCEEALAGRVFQLTDGNPYLTQALCLHLVEHVQGQNRTNIVPDDLDRAVHLVVSDGYRYFAHFTDELGGIAKIALTAVAEACSTRGKWVGIPQLSAQLADRCPALRPEAIHNALHALECRGALAIRNGEDAGAEEVTVAIDLFRQWLRQHYTGNEVAIDEWQGSGTSGSKKRVRRATSVQH